MTKASILALLVTAAGGCAAADEPWTPPPATKAMLGSHIPSDLVNPDAYYVRSRNIDMLAHTGELSGESLQLARSIDGIVTQHADGLLEAEELVEAEQLFDPVDRNKLESLWHFLVSIHL